MALNALTLSTTQGVQGRPFQAAISGLTTGRVEVLGDASPGFSVVNGNLMSRGLPYPVSTVSLREYEPGVGQGFRDTRIDITALTRDQLLAQALASLGAGRTLVRYRTAGTRQPDGSISYSVYAEDDLGATTIQAAGQTYEAARYWMGGGPTDGGAASLFSGASATNVIGTTLHFFEIQGEATEIQLILANASTTTPIEYVGASAVAVADYTDKKQDALFASEAKLFAFGQNGNPTITVGVRSGRNSPTLALSDWIALPAKARTDGATAPAGSKRSDGTLPYMYGVRLGQRVHDGTNATRATYFNKGSSAAINAGWQTGPAQLWASSNTGAPTANLTAAFPTTPTYTNQGFTGYATLAGIRYRSKGKVMTVMMGGSSMVEAGSDDTRGKFGHQRGIYAASTAARPVEACNMGMSTNTSTNARIGMEYATPIIKPSHVLWEFWNPNDVGGGNLTQAQMDTINATLHSNRGLVFAAAQAVGAVGFVYDGYPRNTNATTSWYGASQDGYRLAYLAALPGNGYAVAAVNAQANDGASPQRYQMTANGFAADYTSDFLHPTAAGYIAGSGAITTTINTLKSAFFGG